MKRFLGVLVVTALITGPISPGRAADEKDANPILDKAIAALGGEAKLAKAATATWKAKGTITFNDNESLLQTHTTVDGIDRHRAEFTGEFNGNEVKGVTVLNGKKAWRKFGDESQDLADDMLAAERQRAYLQAVPMILPLKGKGFKVEAAPEEMVGGKTASVVKGTGPDGKVFTLYLDKDTNLPIKLKATVSGFQGGDVIQETTFNDYKDFDGIKRATKAETKRDGNAFTKMEYTEFKILEKTEAGTFDEPK